MKHKTGIRILPQKVPMHCHKGIKHLWDQLETFNTPLLTVFSNHDPITRGGEKILQTYIPGAHGQNHQVLDAPNFNKNSGERRSSNKFPEQVSSVFRLCGYICFQR